MSGLLVSGCDGCATASGILADGAEAEVDWSAADWGWVECSDARIGGSADAAPSGSGDVSPEVTTDRETALGSWLRVNEAALVAEAGSG